MCIMFLKKKEQEVNPDYIQAMYEKGNRDGFGLCYVEGERTEDGKLVRPGRIKVVKSMGVASELKDIFQKHTSENPQAAFIVHLRNATLGDKTEENCHPYQILSIDDGDAIDLVMMHNGTIRDVQVDKAKSDSRNFAENHLRGLLRGRPSMMYEEGFRYFLCSLLGTNKLMFMDNRERVSIINYELGSLHPATGIWMSTRDNVQLPKPHVVPALPAHQTGGKSGFQFGQGQDRSNPATQSQSSKSSSDGPTVVTNRGVRMTWKQPEGSKWVMESDGRSHYIPAGSDTPVDMDRPALSIPQTKEDQEDFVKELIAKSSPPTTDKDLEALRKELAKGSQTDMHQYAKEFPVEAAYLIRYAAQITDLLPEFKESPVEDIVVYCIESSWEAGYALAIASRGGVREPIHEVN